MTSKTQQVKLDNALVAPENRRVIGKCNTRINPGMKPKEPTYQVALDALALTTCYHAFLITAEVPVIYMHQLWATVIKHKSSYQFKIDQKRFFMNVEVFREILNICLKVSVKTFNEPPTEEEAPSFIHELGHNGEIKYITDLIVDHLHQPWRTFASIINKCLCGKDLAYQIDNIDLKKQDKMFYPRFTKIIIHHFLEKDKSISMRNRMFMHTAWDDSLLGAEPPISRKSTKKSDSSISFEETPSKNKYAKVKKVATAKPKPIKKKAPVKVDRVKGLNVLSEVMELILNQRFLMRNISRQLVQMKELVLYQRFPMYPNTIASESEKESWGDSGEEDKDDENNSEDKSNDGDEDNDGNDDNDDDDDDTNDDDNQEGDNTNDDDEEIDSDRTESDIIKTPVLNQSTTEYYEEEEEKIDDEETIDEEEDDEVTKELYKDVNVNLGNEDTEMTEADQGGSEQQNVSQESGFEQVEEDTHLLNLENPSPVDNEIASLMETSARHATAIPKITSGFTTTIPLPPPFFNPLPQQATPTQTPITSKATTSFPSLLDFSFVFKFNDRVTNLEKDLLEIKQVDQYAQALSTIPAIVDRYIDNKLGEAIYNAIQAHNLYCKQEAQDEKNEYIGLVNTSIRTIIKEENIAESLKAAVLKMSSSQPQSTYEAAVALSEFELTKMLIDKMEKNKSYNKAAYKQELYEALVKSYETEKDLFDLYGEVFMLKRSRDDKDKDQDPSAGLDRGTKRRKSSKEAESSKDLSHTVEDSGVQEDQEFVTGDNDEQPADKEVTKADWFKKPERPPTPDLDWNKRQQVDFRTPQT
ncbi:hypothetical protein Tco_0381204 [Tanacetum coccineum]